MRPENFEIQNLTGHLSRKRSCSVQSKFSEYILGKITVVQSDHIPYETIVCKPMGSNTIKTAGNDPEIKWL